MSEDNKIKKVGEMVNLPITDQKKYNAAMKRTIELMSKSGINSEEIENVKKAVEGGKCGYCGTMWRMIEKNVTGARYTYFEADCKCNEEAEKRRFYNNAVKMICKHGEIPERYHETTLKNMELDNVSDAVKKAVEEVKTYVTSKNYLSIGLSLYGSVGTGKTHIAIAVLKYYAASQNKKVLYIPTSDLLQRIIKGDDHYIDLVLKYDGILLDDVDKLSVGRDDRSQWKKEQFFSLIDGIVSRNKLLIMTSNFQSLEEFSARYSDAVFSRMIQACRFIHVNGADYRLNRKKG